MEEHRERRLLLALGVPGSQRLRWRPQKVALLGSTMQGVSSACLSGVACELCFLEVLAMFTEASGRS